MPPERLYVVTSIGPAEAKLVVSPDPGDFRDLEVAYPTFSQHVGERIMRDSEGRSFGTDRWGYLQSGERWRYVKFSTGTAWDMNLCLRAKQTCWTKLSVQCVSRGTKISKSESRGGSCCQLLVSPPYR